MTKVHFGVGMASEQSSQIDVDVNADVDYHLDENIAKPKFSLSLTLSLSLLRCSMPCQPKNELFSPRLPQINYIFAAWQVCIIVIYK